MQTITIKTSQNIDIDYQVASIGDRIKARCIDYGLFWVFYMFVFFAGIWILSPALQNQNSVIVKLMLSWLIICGLYDVIAEVFFKGQTVGKRVVGIRVMSASGKRASVGQYLLRWIFRIIDLGITMGAAAITSIAFTDKKQRLGDLVAGTVIIRTNPLERLDELTFNHEQGEEQVTFREVLQLSDEDIALVKEVIRTYKITGNNIIVFKLAMRIQEHLGIACPPEFNDYEFLELVLKDYDKLVV